MRLLAGLLILAGMMAGGVAQAQTTEHEFDARWTTRIGYYAGQGFTSGASRGRLDGFTFSLDAPLVKRIRNVGALSLTMNVVFGGTTRGGADTDGNIYRFLFTLRRELGRSPVYAGIGLGYGFTDSRGHQFSDSSGLDSYFALGYAFPVRAEAKHQPLIEIGYHAGADNKLSGWTFEAGVRFR